MSMEENAKQFLSIAAPICLVLSPIALLMELHAFFIADPKISKVSEVSSSDLVFLNAMIFGGFFIGLWYCRTYMGWFQKKDK